MITQVTDHKEINIGMIRCDGGGEFEGRFLAQAETSGISVEANAPCIPPGNAIVDRGFGAVIGVCFSQATAGSPPPSPSSGKG